MASSSDPALNEELQCSICLEVFTDPVTTTCGHNFSRTCLSKCWTNTQTCFCPFCNEKFSRRPDLKINSVLGKLVQHFKKLNQEVFCDFCDERKQKAVKSCLMCQSSYCDDHLEPHRRVPSLKKHTMINAVENLEDYICQKQERPLELFCRDDQMCVCLFCTEGEHRNHNITIEEESQDKKTQTDEQQMIQKRMKEIQEIKHSVELKKTLASNYGFLTRTFHISNWMVIGLGVLLVAALIILQIQYTSEKLKMKEQQKAAEKQAEELKRRNNELEKRNTELEQLLHTDHLWMYSSMCSLSHTKNSDVDENSLKRALTTLKKNEKLTQTGDVTEKDDIPVSTVIESNKNSVYHAGLEPDRPLIKSGDIAIASGLQNAEPCTARGCKWDRSKDGKVYVPYIISNQYSPDELSVIQRGMESFTQVSCIRFVPRQGERNYLHIQSISGCYSYLGRQNGKQDVSLERPGCISHRIVQHELLHALGFHHEQSRSDRDDHIQILYQNIIPEKQHNFDKADTNNLDTPYDYNSVMHYSRFAFSMNNMETMIPIPDRNVVIGEAKQMSPNDILRINRLYCS